VGAVNAKGEPVRYAVVRFSLVGATGVAPGTLDHTAALTDADGQAAVRWTLGTTAGVQTLLAQVGTADGSTAVETQVQATAEPGTASSMTPAANAVVAITVGDAVQVAATGVDRYGNATSRFANLTWQVIDPALASVTGTGSVATVTGRAAGATVLEARDATAGTQRFDLHSYLGPGRELAFASSPLSGPRVFRMTADGTITPLTTQNSSDPTWSPDGRQIAFAGPVGGPVGGATAIFVMNADGSGVRALTDTSVVREAEQPAWSPDGRKIAFVAPSADAGDPLVRWAVFTISVDGSGLTRIVLPACAGLGFCRGALVPAWSPDGTRIAYAFQETRSTVPQGYIFVVNADGSGLRQLTPALDITSEPTWSPDGGRIAFQSSRVFGGPGQVLPSDIYTIDADGAGRTRLTFGSANGMSDLAPAWSPDGRLAFTRVQGGPTSTTPGALFVVNGDGTEMRRVAIPAGGAFDVAWKP
jgi:Tol biopolymer transport system component